MSLKGLFSLKTLTHFTVKKFESLVMNASVKRPLESAAVVVEDLADDSSEAANAIQDVTKRAKRSKVGHQLPEHSLDDTDYYVDNGLRKIYPYYFTYFSYCKGRWMGQPLLSFYSQEFGGMTAEKIKERIDCGLLLVNNQKVATDYRLKGHDLLTHRLHRHESPVLSAPIPIIYSSDTMLVIDKPPSIPIHPCGKYRHNTVMNVLAKEQNETNLHLIHRLDRLTSGVLIMARKPATAQRLHEQIRNHEMEKQYVCRVVGKFPDGIITCDQPIETLSHKIGICIVDPNGKACSTTFERLNYNGQSSTVLCRPKTGRMHQIRVHLQYLGHPILNDSFYNNDVFGPDKGKGGQYGKTKDILTKDIDEQHKRWIYFTSNVKELSAEEQVLSDKKRDIALKALQHYTNREEWHVLTEKYKFEKNRLIQDIDCEECTNKTVDPNPSELLIYLHAFSYKGKDFEYKTALPVWALDDWHYD